MTREELTRLKKQLRLELRGCNERLEDISNEKKALLPLHRELTARLGELVSISGTEVSRKHLERMDDWMADKISDLNGIWNSYTSNAARLTDEIANLDQELAQL